MKEKLNAKQVLDRLQCQGIQGASGSVSIDMLGISRKVNQKSAIGNLIEEWLEAWLDHNDIYYSKEENSQIPPDYYLSEDHTSMLEIKCFDYSKSPNFDVANFDAYTRSLLTYPKKLNADYLIFGYTLSSDSILKIERVWLKKVWEICTKSERFAIKCQVKQDKIVNIRPVVWYTSQGNKPFDTLNDFLDAIENTLLKYDQVSHEIVTRKWKQEVLAGYNS